MSEEALLLPGGPTNMAGNTYTAGNAPNLLQHDTSPGQSYDSFVISSEKFNTSGDDVAPGDVSDASTGQFRKPKRRKKKGRLNFVGPDGQRWRTKHPSYDEEIESGMLILTPAQEAALQPIKDICQAALLPEDGYYDRTRMFVGLAIEWNLLDTVEFWYKKNLCGYWTAFWVPLVISVVMLTGSLYMCIYFSDRWLNWLVLSLVIVLDAFFMIFSGITYSQCIKPFIKTRDLCTKVREFDAHNKRMGLIRFKDTQLSTTQMETLIWTNRVAPAPEPVPKEITEAIDVIQKFGRDYYRAQRSNDIVGGISPSNGTDDEELQKAIEASMLSVPKYAASAAMPTIAEGDEDKHSLKESLEQNENAAQLVNQGSDTSGVFGTYCTEQEPLPKKEEDPSPSVNGYSTAKGEIGAAGGLALGGGGTGVSRLLGGGIPSGAGGGRPLGGAALGDKGAGVSRLLAGGHPLGGGEEGGLTLGGGSTGGVSRLLDQFSQPTEEKLNPFAYREPEEVIEIPAGDTMIDNMLFGNGTAMGADGKLEVEAGIQKSPSGAVVYVTTPNAQAEEKEAKQLEKAFSGLMEMKRSNSELPIPEDEAEEVRESLIEFRRSIHSRHSRASATEE